MASKKRTGKIRKQINAYMDNHKCCERCVKSLMLINATDCHHIKPVGIGGAPADSPLHRDDNLVALCHYCHEWAHQATKKSAGELRKLKEDYRENLKDAVLASSFFM